VLAADFARLGEHVGEAAHARVDRLHVDVMDGLFVPNISMGPVVVGALSRCTALPLEVHLMVSSPERHLDAFAKAGASSLIVHQEACVHLHRCVQQIKALGLRAGVALNPATPACLLADILPEIDLVLVMSVNPGFGGQAFIHGTLSKIQTLRQQIDANGYPCELEVDGGINAHTAPLVRRAGASVVVAGTAVFAHPEGVRQGIEQLV